MNRFLNQFPLTFEKKVVLIYAKVAFGTSGAPTLDAKNSKGVISVSRNSAGSFTVQFGTKAGMLDIYNKLMMVRHVVQTSGSAPAAPAMFVTANQVSVVGQASLVLNFNAAGTATDPASGEVAYLEFVFGDSTAP